MVQRTGSACSLFLALHTPYSWILRTRSECSSETSVNIHPTIRRHILEDDAVVATILQTGKLRNRGSIPGRGNRFIFFSITAIAGLGSTQASIQLVRGAVSPAGAWSWQHGVKNGGTIPPLSHTLSRIGITFHYKPCRLSRWILFY